MLLHPLECCTTWWSTDMHHAKIQNTRNSAKHPNQLSLAFCFTKLQSGGRAHSKAYFLKADCFVCTRRSRGQSYGQKKKEGKTADKFCHGCLSPSTESVCAKPLSWRTWRGRTRKPAVVELNVSWEMTKVHLIQSTLRRIIGKDSSETEGRNITLKHSTGGAFLFEQERRLSD